MNRTKSLVGKLVLAGLCAVALAGCYYGPGYGPEPAYYAAPAPAYYGPPVYGSVVIGGGGGGWGHDHWR